MQRIFRGDEREYVRGKGRKILQHRELLGVKLSPIFISYFSDAKRGESAMQKLPPFLYALRGGNSRKFSFSTFSTRKELSGGKLSQICMFSKLFRGGNSRNFFFYVLDGKGALRGGKLLQILIFFLSPTQNCCKL